MAEVRYFSFLKISVSQFLAIFFLLIGSLKFLSGNKQKALAATSSGELKILPNSFQVTWYVYSFLATLSFSLSLSLSLSLSMFASICDSLCLTLASTLSKPQGTMAD